MNRVVLMSFALGACGTTPPLVGRPGTSQWEAGARAALLAYDDDGDGRLEAGEVGAVPCALWRDLDEACRAQAEGGLATLYGLPRGYVFRGAALGLARDAREAATLHLEGCVGGVGQTEAQVALIRHLHGLEERPATRPWDEAVARALIDVYDLDGSGRIDTGREVLAIPCEVVVALEEAVLGASNTPLLALYGFATGYEWVGEALGFSPVIRAEATSHFEGCGLSD